MYLTFTAIINGARSVDDVAKTLKAGFFKALQVTWMTLPLTMVIAQRYLAPELWVPFINLVQFCTGVSVLFLIVACRSCPILQTYFNTKLKKIRMAMEAKAKKDEEEKKE